VKCKGNLRETEPGNVFSSIRFIYLVLLVIVIEKITARRRDSIQSSDTACRLPGGYEVEDPGSSASVRYLSNLRQSRIGDRLKERREERGSGANRKGGKRRRLYERTSPSRYAYLPKISSYTSKLAESWLYIRL
jgi:hypothetical protein